MATPRRVLYAAIAVLAPTLALTLAVEFAIRWRVTGGAVAALQTFLPEPSSSRAWMVGDPDLGYRLNPAKEGVNSLGLVGGELAPVPEGGARVIVLGDSVAFEREGFVAMLGERLGGLGAGGIEVVNASIPGYTTRQERLLFERDLARHEPDLVLLQYCLNDNHRTLHRMEPGGHWVMVPEARAGDAASPWPDWIEASYIVKRIRWRQRARREAERETADPMPWRRSREFGNAWREETWPEFERELLALRDAARRVEAPLAVVAVPYEPQLDAVARGVDPADALFPQRRLGAIASRAGVPLLDLYDAFETARRTPGTVLFTDGIHLSDAGHRLTAAEIEAFLAREGLLARLTGDRGDAAAPGRARGPGRPGSAPPGALAAEPDPGALRPAL